MTIKSTNIVPHGFAVSVLLLPIISLLWQIELFYGIKANWLVYPLFLSFVAISMLLRQKITIEFALLVLFSAFYLILAVIHSGDTNALLRFFICLLPFSFYGLSPKKGDELSWFWTPYLIILTVPLYCAYLQYTGQMPHYDFDTIDGTDVGRITAGYSQPMNFIVFIFPIYIYGFYLAMIKGNRLVGYGVILAVLFLLVIIGHRTSLVGFLIVFIAHFLYRLSAQLVKMYYKYFLPFIVGITSFVALYIYKIQYGFLEGLRGRIPMWLAHAETFFKSGPIEILLGQQEVMLDPKQYTVSPLLASLEEVHNNTFRIIIYFGVAGFALYCVLVRWLVLNTYRNSNGSKMRFLKMSCFIFLIFFSITNEPLFYGGILWPILLCLFPVFQLAQEPQTNS